MPPVDTLSENILDSTLKQEDVQKQTTALRTREARDGYLLGYWYLRNDDYSNAIRAYRRLIVLEPDFPYAHYHLGFAHYKEGEFEDAQQAIEHAIELDPSHPRFHFTLGLLLYDMRQYEHALQSFSSVVELRPSWVEAFCYQGMIHSRFGQLEEASVCYERALEIQPDRRDAIHRLGLIYLQIERWDDAHSLLSHRLKNHPDDADAHYYLGEVAVARKNWDSAIKHFEESVSLDPTHPYAHFQAATIYAKQRYTDARQQPVFREQAVHHLNQIIGLNEEFPGILESIDQAYFLLGSLYDDRPEDAQEAINAYQKGLQYSDSAAAHNNLGVLYWRGDRIDEASHEFQAAIQNDPEYDSAYYNLAKLYFYRQDEQMMRDFELWTHREQQDAAKVLYRLSLALMDVARSEAYQGLYSRLHQIKNLMGISGAKLRSAQRMLQQPDTLEKQLSSAFDEQQNCYDEMVQLLQSLRQDDVHIEFLNIGRLLGSLVEYMSATFRMSGVKCTLSMQDELPHVKADPTQIKEALHNVILNAVEAMENGGQLRIAAEYSPRHAEVSLRISDTGVGIPTAMRQDVFKPGYSTKTRGSGFGLSIVERTILAHRGRITLDSTEGEGTTIQIYLPVDMEATPTYTTLQMRPILYEAPHDLIADEDFA